MTDRAFSTRQRILHNGMMALSKSGLSGVTLGTLAGRVGMSKSGLFAHFRSIDEVQIGVLRYTTDIVQQTVVMPAMQSPKGLRRLRALIRNWFGWSRKAGLEGGCPIAAGLFELDDDGEGPVRDEVLSLEHRWRAFLSGLVRDAIECGELHGDLDVDQFVWELCGIYLSHHASARFVRDPHADRRAETALAALFGRAGEVAPKRKPGVRRARAAPERPHKRNNTSLASRRR